MTITPSPGEVEPQAVAGQVDVMVVTMRLTGEVARLPDRYLWKCQAGKGGMGVVHQALDRRTGALVAVKVLHSRGVVEMARFEQEAKVLAELRHPGIVRYSDHGTTPEGSPYIAMEWLEGETLEERLLRGRLSCAEVARVAHCVLGALAAAHSRDIVHRDIKPGNIFLVGCRLDDIRVLDFGIARRRLDIKRFTRDGATVGTPLYTSPEQARGRGDVDGRADIFSLGCVLFEALAGEPPFTGESPLEVMTRVCAGHPADLDAKRPGLPTLLSALVRSMLAAEPARRPQSAAGLADEFAKLEDHGSADVPLKRARTPVDERVTVAMLVRVQRDHGHGETLSGGLHRLAKHFGCIMDRLIDRSFLFTAPCSSLEEQATSLARLALALREAEPDAHVAIAGGRTALAGHLPVGPLMERLPAMIRAQSPTTICVDETARRLLPGSFRMAAGPTGYLLLSCERADGEGPVAGAHDGREPVTPAPKPHRHHRSVADG